MLDIKKDFPFLVNNNDLLYLDTNATSIKPKAVLDKMNEYYTNYGVNIHRGVYEASYKATKEYDEAREKIAEFINASVNETVFFKNVTSALNFVALSLEKEISEGDEIITSELEHHSSFLPWQQLAKRKGAKIVFVPLTDDGKITLDNFKKVLSSKTKIVALTYVSNVLGYITPIEEIIKEIKGKNIISIIDAAQAIPHIKIDVKRLGCDFLGFSGHKMLGPTGVGVLYGRFDILKKFSPLEYGGDMNEAVKKDTLEIKEVPYCFEAGTPMIAEVIGLKEAVSYYEKIGFSKIEEHEKILKEYLFEKIKLVEGITIYNKASDFAVLAFNIDGVHPHDAATFFDEYKIALRAGHHCAQLVSQFFNAKGGTLRASFYIYNSKEDIDRFIIAIKEIVKFFKRWN